MVAKRSTTLWMTVLMFGSMSIAAQESPTFQVDRNLTEAT
jgi:hypothetical protein